MNKELDLKTRSMTKSFANDKNARCIAVAGSGLEGVADDFRVLGIVIRPLYQERQNSAQE
ncbi:MAG: hypothetical protein ACLP05_03675 [Candidatus Kryptoniota bacterium]